ncbi:hypothetical protein H6504_01010 [Candidatus Woesearchaeota archaeon]|nr:hypothetical protein [Candidatus Woesearchaeota archaeon]
MDLERIVEPYIASLEPLVLALAGNLGVNAAIPSWSHQSDLLKAAITNLADCYLVKGLVSDLQGDQYIYRAVLLHPEIELKSLYQYSIPSITVDKVDVAHVGMYVVGYSPGDTLRRNIYLETVKGFIHQYPEHALSVAYPEPMNVEDMFGKSI